MGLRTVLAAVEKRVVTVLTAAGGKIPNFGFGEAAKFTTEAPPRVTWVPTGGRVTVGDERIPTVRKLWKRHLQMQVRVWAEDFDATEALAAHVWAAFTFVHNARYSLLSETWDTESNLQKGVLGVFLLEVRLAFADEPDKLVDGTTTPIVSELDPEIG